jgi:hypothetical protein
MIENTKNKMINEAPENKAVEQQYHFGGSGQFEPMTVIAHSIEEATEIWKKQRKPTSQLTSEERN